jgi:DNA-binding MarR family transcriptional regulator
MSLGLSDMAVSSKVLMKVYRYLKRNANAYEDLGNSYVSEMARDLGYDRSHIHDAVEAMDEMNMIRTYREGQKRIIELEEHVVGESNVENDRLDAAPWE